MRNRVEEACAECLHPLRDEPRRSHPKNEAGRTSWKLMNVDLNIWVGHEKGSQPEMRCIKRLPQQHEGDRRDSSVSFAPAVLRVGQWLALGCWGGVGVTKGAARIPRVKRTKVVEAGGIWGGESATWK